MNDESGLLTIPACAAYLQISVAKCYALASRNELPGVVRIGPRSIRVSRRKIDEWLDALVTHEATDGR